MKILITGGAGFIGSNAASRYLRDGHEVIILDNLSRPGGEKNLEWLQSQGLETFLQVDVRDSSAVTAAFEDHADATRVLHLAGQVAVTTSVQFPRFDFEVNALGTLNVLEALRLTGMDATLIYASTNKVYGNLTHLQASEKEGHYTLPALENGLSEETQIDFHSPYGCSKGSADQYVIDYHRIYGLKTVVFRQSCIYGYRQFGAEDQGWVAWFLIASRLDQMITVYGDGRQVRDVLFIDDLLDAYDLAFCSAAARGRVYNIGGGPQNVLSILDLLAFIQSRHERKCEYKFDEWRPGDQKVFVSDIRRATAELGWKPRVCSKLGLNLLDQWVGENLELFQ